MPIENFLLLTHWKPYYAQPDTIPVITDVVANLDPNGPKLYAALCYSYLQDIQPGSFPETAVLGADNMLQAGEGSYAEHFAATMLLQVNATFVIVGESESRYLLNEDDTSIASKVACATQTPIKTMLCVGETAAEYAHGASASALERQLSTCLQGLSPEQLQHLTIVYQGPWPTFFQLSGLPETLHKCLGVLQNVLTNQGTTLPVIVALPNHVSNMTEVVNATAPLCEGYYISNAVTNPTLIVDAATALIEWRNKPAAPPAESEVAQPEEP